MGRWIARQYNDIKGNFKYDAIKTVIIGVLGLVSAGVIAALMTATSKWLHRPTSNVDLLIVVAVLLLASLLIALTLLPRRPAVSLTPHGTSSTDLVLSVVNHATEDIFFAEAQLIARNIHSNFKQMPFDLSWQGNSEKAVSIQRNKSRNLLIAGHKSLEDNPQLSSMYFYGLDEYGVWEVSDKEAQLPSYVMRISIFSRHSRNPHISYFRVSPDTFRGPLKMVECQRNEVPA
jgi:hypothetical protein